MCYFISYCKSLAHSIIRIKSCSKQFCAVSLIINDPLNDNNYYQTLIINLCIVIPTDYGTPESKSVFLDCLGEFEGFISTQSFDNIIIGGDFNVDSSCDNHSYNRLLNFMLQYNFARTDTSSNIRFTYRRDDHSVTSWPDHILTLCHNVSQILDAACLDSMVCSCN